jgi:hypothetical protein
VPRPDVAAAAAHPVDPHASLGWREWVALPGLGIGAIKAKLDSGARSSSLDVEAIEAFDLAGVAHVRFQVRVRRRGNALVACSAPVLDRRNVTDSGGHRSARWFIRVELEIALQRFSTEMNLTDRRAMLFPLLLGRSALAGRFHIDPASSYCCPRPPLTHSPGLHA